jgi:hypothetical protein
MSSHWPFQGRSHPDERHRFTDEQVFRLTPFLDAMVEEGLIAASTVEVIRYLRQKIPTIRTCAGFASHTIQIFPVATATFSELRCQNHQK